MERMSGMVMILAGRRGPTDCSEEISSHVVMPSQLPRASDFRIASRTEAAKVGMIGVAALAPRVGAGQYCDVWQRRARLAHVLDLFAADFRRNVYAGEREVRPPGAPTTESE